MIQFPSSKYLITPITDEATYMRFCEWAEEISDLTFEDKAEEEKQFAYLDRNCLNMITIQILRDHVVKGNNAKYYIKSFEEFHNLNSTIANIMFVNL